MSDSNPPPSSGAGDPSPNSDPQPQTQSTPAAPDAPSPNVIQFPAQPRKRDLAAEIKTAPATMTLAAINIVLFILLVLFTGIESAFDPRIETLVKWGADFGPDTTNGQQWRLLTCMFLHIGLLHILLNMWVLLDAGPIIENMFGTPRFLIIYFLSGLGASCVSLLWNPILVSAGASGAIFGIVGAMLAFATLQRNGPDSGLNLQRQKSILAFVGYNLAFGLTQSNVDNGAHIGGLIFGMLTGAALLPDSAKRTRAQSIAGVVVVAGLVAGGSVLAGSRVASNPAVITERMGHQYNVYIRSVRPLLQPQDDLKKELVDTYAQEGGDRVKLKDLATNLAIRADAEVERFKSIQIPDQALAPLHAAFSERAVQISKAAHALTTYAENGDASAITEFRSALEKANAALTTFQTEKENFSQKYGVKFK